MSLPYRIQDPFLGLLRHSFKGYVKARAKCVKLAIGFLKPFFGLGMPLLELLVFTKPAVDELLRVLLIKILE